MVKLTEDMIVARTRSYLAPHLPGIYGVLLTRVGDLASVKRLNCWGADLDDVSVLRRLEGKGQMARSAVQKHLCMETKVANLRELRRQVVRK